MLEVLRRASGTETADQPPDKKPVRTDIRRTEAAGKQQTPKTAMKQQERKPTQTVISLPNGRMVLTGRQAENARRGEHRKPRKK